MLSDSTGKIPQKVEASGRADMRNRLRISRIRLAQ
jgi:hypothetical protein